MKEKKPKMTKEEAFKKKVDIDNGFNWGRCKGCDKRIVWGKLQYIGKSIPCDLIDYHIYLNKEDGNYYASREFDIHSCKEYRLTPTP